MITVCKFDKDRDFQETIPDLEISIEMALTTGVISDSGTTTPYNEMESTEQVGNYLHDPIDIALEARRVGSYLNQQTSPNTESLSNPVQG